MGGVSLFLEGVDFFGFFFGGGWLFVLFFLRDFHIA